MTVGLPRRRLRCHNCCRLERQLVQDRGDGLGVKRPRLLGYRSAQREFCPQHRTESSAI